MGDVIKGSFKTTGPVPAEKVLEAAQKGGLKDVFILGWTTDGQCYTASSTGSKPELLFLLELAREWIMER